MSSKPGISQGGKAELVPYVTFTTPQEDKTPPTVILTVNNGAETTSSRDVSLFINSYDNITPQSELQMRVSNDGTTWSYWDTATSTWKSGWGPYVAHPGTWTLTEGGGTKYVYVQVRDADGNIGIAAKNIFLLDGTNTPTGAPGSTVTAQAGSAPNLHGHIIIVEGEATQVVQGINATIQLTNLQNATHIMFSHDNILWSHAELIPTGADSFSKSISFPGEGKRKVYVKLRNQNGAESDVITVSYLVDSTPPVIKSLKTSSGATASKTNSIQLYLSAQDSVSKKLFYRINGGAFAPLPDSGLINATLSASGLNNLTVQVIDEAGNMSEEVIRIWKL